MMDASPSPNVPSGSVGRRPAYRIDGYVPVPETVYPAARSPYLSIATDASKRLSLSGANVPCWYTFGVVDTPRISYHRMPACSVLPDPTFTAWLNTIDSWSPKLRYA